MGPHELIAAETSVKAVDGVLGAVRAVSGWGRNPSLFRSRVNAVRMAATRDLLYGSFR